VGYLGPKNGEKLGFRVRLYSTNLSAQRTFVISFGVGWVSSLKMMDCVLYMGAFSAI
jgi:hypothetical protein